MSNKRITKIQYKGEKVLIKWEVIRNGHADKKSLESRIEPHADFVNTMRALDKPLCHESELHENEDEYKRHDIQSVDISWDEDELGNLTYSASITSERFMEQTMERMKIVSPMKPRGGEMSLFDLTVEVIETLIEEAELYLEGKRHDLFSITEKQKEIVGD